MPSLATVGESRGAAHESHDRDLGAVEHQTVRLYATSSSMHERLEILLEKANLKGLESPAARAYRDGVSVDDPRDRRVHERHEEYERREVSSALELLRELNSRESESGTQTRAPIEADPGASRPPMPSTVPHPADVARTSIDGGQSPAGAATLAAEWFQPIDVGPSPLPVETAPDVPPTVGQMGNTPTNEGPALLRIPVGLLAGAGLPVRSLPLRTDLPVDLGGLTSGVDDFLVRVSKLTSEKVGTRVTARFATWAIVTAIVLVECARHWPTKVSRWRPRRELGTGPDPLLTDEA